MLSVMHFEKYCYSQITAQNDKWHNPTTILHFRDCFGCFQVRFNDILPVVNSKIVDNYNNLLN